MNDITLTRECTKNLLKETERQPRPNEEHRYCGNYDSVKVDVEICDPNINIGIPCFLRNFM